MRISVKLMTLTSLLVMVSLISMTALVWGLMKAELTRTATVHNNEINALSATTAERFLQSAVDKTTTHLKFLAALEMEEKNTAAKKALASEQFFSHTPEVAAFAVLTADSAFALSGSPLTEVGTDFSGYDTVARNELASFGNLPSSLQAAKKAHENRQTVVLNGAPVFHKPILTLYSPGESERVTMTLVNTTELGALLGTGTNFSFVVNSAGEVLIHPNLGLLEMQATTDMSAMGKTNFVARNDLAAAEASVVTTIPQEVVFEGLNATVLRNCYLALGIWFLGIIFVWFFSHTIADPLERLTKTVRQIEEGNYHNTKVAATRDEVGVLAAAVESMSYVLGNFEMLTNKEIARLARKDLLKLGGETRDISVFFSDIRNFTEISGSMKPADVVGFLNDYLERMVAAVTANNGAIDKFIGDAVMAHWGAVGENAGRRENAYRAVRTALMMRSFLGIHNAERGDSLKIGCGVSSGPVVVGLIGSEDRMEFTVIGRTVAFADRAEGWSKRIGADIVISEETFDLVKDMFITEEVSPLRSGNALVRMYAVINVNGDEEEKLWADIDALCPNRTEVTRKFLGSRGPRTLRELRSLLGLMEPDKKKANTDEDEKKYAILP